MAVLQNTPTNMVGVFLFMHKVVVKYVSISENTVVKEGKTIVE